MYIDYIFSKLNQLISGDRDIDRNRSQIANVNLHSRCRSNNIIIKYQHIYASCIYRCAHMNAVAFTPVPVPDFFTVLNIYLVHAI
jgi:hypothetical protein